MADLHFFLHSFFIQSPCFIHTSAYLWQPASLSSLVDSTDLQLQNSLPLLVTLPQPPNPSCTPCKATDISMVREPSRLNTRSSPLPQILQIQPPTLMPNSTGEHLPRPPFSPCPCLQRIPQSLPKIPPTNLCNKGLDSIFIEHLKKHSMGKRCGTLYRNP